MITALPTRKLTILLLVTFFYINSASAGIEPVPSGSLIVNMGVIPQTYSNGLKPWGMIWNLIHFYKVPVKWVIGQSKAKDGIDFTYNGTDFKGGTFIIAKKYRSAAVDSAIANWQSRGVVAITTTSDFSVDVTYTLKYNPLWTFDFQNGKIAQNYLTIAGIPISSYPMKDPNALNDCDDLFVMPHADPTWNTHQNLMYWNSKNKGWLWYGCHAGSVIESTLNPLDSSQQMNFLTTTGLINFSDHSNPTTPYSYRFPSEPEMQFIGTIDAAVTNGSEQVYLPKSNGGWRSSTHVAVWDPTNPDVPSLSAGEAAIIAYGRAFGDTSKGKVMFQAGHSFDKGNSSAVAAIRAFFNFSYLSVLDKIVTPNISGPITGTGAGSYNYSATLQAGYNTSNYSFHWTSSCGGTFSNEFGATTSFTPAGVGTCTNCIIYVSITDGCGREYYQTIDFNACPVPPVALDRTSKTILNPPGTGAQPLGSVTPLAGNDADGYVVNYLLQSLPANGVLYYDNDNNISTPDISITSVPSGGLLLNGLQMKSLKFDPVENFGGNTSFQYTVQDNTSLASQNTATYIIPVNPPPIAQTFVCTPVASNADVTAVCPLVATDNNSVVSYTIATLPATSKCSVYLYKALVTTGQVITPAQASLLTYKPSGNYIGYAEITYTATDNDGAVDQTPATITLQMVNQPPAAKDVADTTITTNISGNIQINIPALAATDNDGTVASYTITNAPVPSEGILYYNNNGVYTQVYDNQILTVAQSATLKFNPADNYSGVTKFKFVATDNLGLTSNITATYSIPVKIILPVTNNANYISVYAGVGVININGLLSGTTADITKTITSFIIKTVPSADKGVITYHASGNSYPPVTAGMEIATNSLRFQPNPSFAGNITFTYAAKDNAGLVDPAGATVSIPVTNAAPIVSNINNTTIKDTSGSVTIKPLVATDADGIIAKFIILTLPDPATGVLKLNGVAVKAGQEISTSDAAILQFDPVVHNSQDAVFKFTAIDNLGLVDPTPANFTIPITMVNYKWAPKADNKNNPKLNLKAIARNILPVSGSDSDGVITSYQITRVNKASEGTLKIQGVSVSNNQVISAAVADKLTFVPSGTFKGTSAFDYIAIDNDGNSSVTATFNIPLSNSLPVAKDLSVTQIQKNTTDVIPGLAASDSDGTVSSYKILSLPALGTLQYDSSGAGVWKNATNMGILTPMQASRIRIIAGNIIGTASFKYTAKDNLNDTSNVATYTIPISTSAVNQKPIVYDITSSMVMTAGQTLINPLSGVDPDGTVTGYIIQNIPPDYIGTLYYDSVGLLSVLHGLITITPTQASTLKFMPAGIYSGNVSFSYKAIDNNNEYSTTEATYTISLTDPGPVASNITNTSVPSNAGPTILTPLSGTGLITKYIITDLPDPATGILIIDGTPVNINQEIPAMYANRLEFSPNNSFSGNAKFKFTVLDKYNVIDNSPATFTIPVTNQAPFADDKLSQVITNYIGTPIQAIPALTAIDFDGTISAFIIRSLPAGGKLYKNGTLISTLPIGGLSITPFEGTQLSFDPDDNYGGSSIFTYTAKDNNNNISASAATYQLLINTPPITSNFIANAMFGGQDRTPLPGLVASDDGTVAFYSILTLPNPNDGTLYLNNVPVTNLAQVDSLSALQISQLSFQPLVAFAGTIFSYTATDNTGLIDVTPAVYNIPYVALAPLPLQLLSFNAFKTATDDVLKWSTSQEINSHHFDVQESSDGTNFIKIGTVTARGNSSIKSDYSFTDKNVTNGTHYYRLKLVSIDGNYKFSNIVAIKRDRQILLISKIMPNPFKDKIEIELLSENNGNTRFDIYDINGKNIKSINGNTMKGLNTIIINGLENLASGLYLLKIKNNETEVQTKLFKSSK